jgi:magnesium transporter
VAASLIAGGAVGAADRDELEQRLARDEFFWLDLCAPTGADLSLLREVFGFHPLAVEDSEHFGQRAKIEDYDDVVFLVVYGAAPAPDEDRLVEVHCFYSERFLVTVRRDEAPALDGLARQCEQGRLRVHEPIALLHRVLDSLVDSFIPLLDDFDDRIEQIQAALISQPGERLLHDLFAMRRTLVAVRRAITPQRELMLAVVGGAIPLPGMTDEAEHHLRDVYDHLVRLSETIDGDRDLLAGTMDLYISLASNRTNAVMKQLTVIATVFLPLAFVVGFFGQNFPWLVEHIGGLPAFLGLGIGLDLLVVAAMVVFFRRRGWF